jgi:hypothetical protein
MKIKLSLLDNAKITKLIPTLKLNFSRIVFQNYKMKYENEFLITLISKFKIKNKGKRLVE